MVRNMSHIRAYAKGVHNGHLKMHHGYRSLQFEHTLDYQAGTMPRLELERNHLAALPDLSYSHTLTHNRTASRDTMVSF